MKTLARPGRRGPAKSSACDKNTEDADITCFKCGAKGHRARACGRKTWCNHCKSDTHKDATCRRKDRKDGGKERKDGARKASKEHGGGGADYAFRIKDEETAVQRKPARGIQEKGLMVDTGATSHIVTDITKFKKFDDTFKPETHCVELADGTLCNGVAQRKGDAEVCLIDSGGQLHTATLRKALFIPSYPQDIFSVKAATTSGATVVFREGEDALIHKDGTRFNIHVYDRLYYLHTEADTAPYGKVKCMRSDNGTEFTSRDFQTLLRKNGIRHETSAPYSPHQNGTAERGWRTLFEMGQCMLIESQLPKHLWNYAVQTAAIVRNRCFNKRTGKTPYQLLTDKEPNLSKMQKFGSLCYTYRQDKGKLDSRCDQGHFVSYDKNSPAYYVHHPETGRVQKHRLVKFVNKATVERQTLEPDLNDDYDSVTQPRASSITQEDNERTENVQEPGVRKQGAQSGSPVTMSDHSSQAQPSGTSEGGRYPTRERRKPSHLKDFLTEDSDSDGIHTTIDYCYRAVCGVPQTFREAMGSADSKEWFRHLTKEQLEGLAEEHEVTVPDNTKKPTLIKLLMTELELEDIWAGEEKSEASEAEQAEREAERSSRIQLAKLEVEHAKAVHGPAPPSRFDVSPARHFMPKFREEDADTFFEAFEIVAREMEWPDAKWALLVQSSLAGKAQVAFAALDPCVGLDDDELMKAVLAAYGGVPESYRQRFQNLKRRNGESYLGVGLWLSIAFDR
ncbi:hypothetical protein SKAU_G00152670 [Synaphobranchus kaupii]|uniref:Uncharacterized protein n=1 Tax=Synaphobranchus kaupii TaxID=118154 RepID=A0A9Q1IZ44_SYNKA|nr:hypothetical protein SKAU_G00152670 [Synaphobranchus kaupii]